MRNARSEKVNVGNNVIFQILNELLAILSPLITTPYLSRVLGPTELGRYSYAHTIAYYFVVIGSIGINVYGSRQIAAVKHDREKLDQTFSNLFCFCCLTGLLTFAIYLIGVLSGHINGSDRMISLIMAFYVCSNVFNVRWLFQGLELFSITVTRNVLIRCFSIVCIFLFVKDRSDTSIYALITVAVSNFLGELLLFMLSPRYVRFKKPKLSAVTSEFLPLLCLFVPYAANLLLRHFDKVMLGMMSTLTQIGYYEDTDRLYMMLIMFNSAIGDVLLPRVTSLISQNKENKAYKMLSVTLRINIILSCAFAFGISAISNEFIPLFLGNEFWPCVTLVKTISPTIVLLAFSSIIRKVYILPRYMTKVYTTATVSALITNVTLNAFLIPGHGAFGAIIATLVAEVVVVLIQFAFIHKELDYGPFVKDAVLYSLIGAVMYVAVRQVARLPMSHGLLIPLEITVGACLYLSLCAIVLRRKGDELWVSFFNFIHKKVHVHMEEISIPETEKCGSGKNPKPDIFYGYYKDQSKLLSTASGGAATAFSEAVLRRGGLLYGAVFSPDFQTVEYVRLASEDGLCRVSGSKYVASRKIIRTEDGEERFVFACVADDLKDGKMVLFTGLGCDVGALKKYLSVHGIQDENLYTIDLVCHGVTFPGVQKQFVERLEDKYQSKIKDLVLRGKKKSWKPYIVKAEFENGKTFEKKFYSTDYGYAFNLYCRPSCYHCQFKGEDHRSDITVGDYYGLSPEREEYSQFGTSLIVVNRKEKGARLMDMLDREEFAVGSTDASYALKHNRNYSVSLQQPAYWKTFDERYRELGLHKAATGLYRLRWTFRREVLAKVKAKAKGIIKGK